MAVSPTKTMGYLLIELLISLTAIALCSLYVARLQVHLKNQQYEAEQYLKAVTYAHSIFEEHAWGTQERDGYTMTTKVCRVEDQIPYKHVVVTMSFKTAGGDAKELVILGGELDEST